MPENARQLSDINVNVDGQVFVVKPSEFLTVDYFKIKDHLLKYPGDFAWIGSLKEAVSRQVSEAEFELELVYAKLDSKFRAQLVGGKSREVDREVKSNVLQSEEYKVARNKLLSLQYVEGKVKAVLAALAKTDSILIQLSTLYKAENKQ